MHRFVLLLLFFVAACSSSRLAYDAPGADLPGAFPNHSAADIAARVRAGADGLVGIRVEGDIAVTSPKQNGRFGMRMVASRDGFLYLTVRPGFGIEAARVLVRPDSFFVHNRIDKTLTLGSMDDAQAALPVPITSEEGFATVTGTLVPPSGAGWTVSADSALYYLRSADGRQVVTVDPALWRVVRTVAYDDGGALVEERRFDRFADVGGHTLARRVVLIRPVDQIQATLLYREVEVNPADAPPRALAVGAGVKREPVGGE